MRLTDVRVRDVLLVSGLAVCLGSLVAAAPRGREPSGMEQLRALGKGILLYTEDYETYPLSMGLMPGSNQWMFNRMIEAPAGFRRETSWLQDPPLAGVRGGDVETRVQRQEPQLRQNLGSSPLAAYRSAWVNAVYPYWPSATLLKIAGAPIEGPRTPLVDTITDPWLVGLTYNGLLHRYPKAGVASLGAVPLVWTGQGRANREGFAVSSPNLMCMLPDDPCLFDPKAMLGGMKSVMFMALGTVEVFDGAMLFAMADGSVKRVVPDLKRTKPEPELAKTSEDPWAFYERTGRPMSYYTDGAYPMLFRPDRIAGESSGRGGEARLDRRQSGE